MLFRSNFLLNAGGQLYAQGQHGRFLDEPWGVGIQDPDSTRGDVLKSIVLTNESSSTSGDYESFFMEGGVRYHHILDMKTGMPARSKFRSATVVCRDATVADALSTSFFILGDTKVLRDLLHTYGCYGIGVTSEKTFVEVLRR